MTADLVRTAWAAMLVISVSGSFTNEEDRKEMAGTAMVVEHLQDVGDFSPKQTELALEALLLVFQDEQAGEPPSDGQLAALLSTERLALAYLTLSDQADRHADASYDPYESMLVSVALSMFRLETNVVMTHELHEQRRELTRLRDALEETLQNGRPLKLSPADAFTLRQGIISSIASLSDQPYLIERLEIMPDLRAALTVPRLNDAYLHLIALERDTAAVA